MVTGYFFAHARASLALLALLASAADAVEDGIYETAADGGLGKRVALTASRGQILSENNANDHWSCFFCYPAEGHLPGNRYAVVLGGKLRRISGWGSSGTAENDFSLTLGAGEEGLAKTLFGLPVLARHHPGHQIDGTFSVAKAVYAPGDKITVTLVIRNLGDQPFLFQKGGHQRGPRDDQFTFSGEGPDGSLEIKKAMNFGGLSSTVVIPAHGELSLSADLDGWINTAKPGHYRLMASYLLPIHADQADIFPIWVDYLTRPFEFSVQEKPVE